MKHLMKLFLISSLLIAGVVFSYSQIVDSVPIEKYKVEYAQVIGTYGSVSFNVEVDLPVEQIT